MADPWSMTDADLAQRRQSNPTAPPPQTYNEDPVDDDAIYLPDGALPDWMPQSPPVGYNLPAAPQPTGQPAQPRPAQFAQPPMPLADRPSPQPPPSGRVPPLPTPIPPQQSPVPAQAQPAEPEPAPPPAPAPAPAPPVVPVQPAPYSPASTRPAAPVSPPIAPPAPQQLVVTLPNMSPPAKPAPPAPQKKGQPANRYRVRDDSDMVKSPDKGVGGWWRRTTRSMGRQPALPTQELLRRIKTPLGAPKVIVFANQDGGCAKTTTCCAVGQELATHRRDRIIAVDGASAVGGLTQRLPVDNQSTIRTLLTNLPTVRKWTDARQHTSMGRTGLELLASGNSIADDELLTADDYRNVIDVLTAHDTYNLILVDCEAGVTSDLMDEVFLSADLVVIPAAGQDGVAGAIGVANRLAYLMDKYPQHAAHFGELLTNAVLVLTRLNARSTIKENAVSTMFRENIGITKIHRIPFDGLLIDGMPVDISRIDKRTESNYLGLAAEIVSSLAQASHG